jgi:hypothetical protein
MPPEDNILALQWQEIKDEMGRNACLATVPGGLETHPGTPVYTRRFV